MQSAVTGPTRLLLPCMFGSQSLLTKAVQYGCDCSCDTQTAITESAFYVISVNDATPFFLLSESTCCLYGLGPVHDHVYGDNKYSVAAFAICV